MGAEDKIGMGGKRRGILAKFGTLYILFAVVMLVVSGIYTYINQTRSYHSECQTNLQNLTRFLENMMEKDGEEFEDLFVYFKDHYDQMRIPVDFADDNAAWLTFDNLFEKDYPGKVFNKDIFFEDLNPEVQRAYAEYQFQRWLLMFEEARDAFGLSFTYFLYPTAEPDTMCYMIDYDRIGKEIDGEMYLDLGITSKQDPETFPMMWRAWETGEAPDGFDVFDNDIGHTYAYYYPLSIHGEKVGLVSAEIGVANVTRTIMFAVLNLFVGLGLVVLLGTTLLLFFIRSKFLVRIVRLEEHVEAYAGQAEKNVAIAEEIERTKTDDDEIGSLSRRFAQMIRDLDEYMVNLQTVTKEKERISAELNVATDIQASMLPQIFPAFPNRKEFDIFASMNPAKEVGGDFYDFFMVDDKHLAVVIADVSGKGVPAALFMVIAKTLIKNNAQAGDSPNEVCFNTNNQLMEGNAGELFVTAWIGIYDIESGELVFADAGHELPFLCHADGRVELVKPKRKKPPLATMEDIPYMEGTIQLQEGDTLFLYTDGVPEATNAHNELFGMERLEKVMQEHFADDPAVLLPNVRREVDAFVGDAPQFDDLTMLSLKIRYLGKNKGQEE